MLPHGQGWIFNFSRQDSAGEESFTFQVYHLVSAMETQIATYLVMVSLMMMLPSSTKPVLVLSFDFWFDRFRIFTCRNWGINFPHTLFEVCPAHKTRQRSSAWALLVGKHQHNQKFTYSFLTVGILNKMKLMLCALFNYNMGDKIRRITKRVELLNLWKDYPSL